MRKTKQSARTALPRPASLATDPDRLERMWAMTPAQRRHAAETGQLSLGEMLRWAAQRPSEVPVVDGEFFFVTALAADAASGRSDAQAFWEGDYEPLPADPASAPSTAATADQRSR